MGPWTRQTPTNQDVAKDPGQSALATEKGSILGPQKPVTSTYIVKSARGEERGEISLLWTHSVSRSVWMDVPVRFHWCPCGRILTITKQRGWDLAGLALKGDIAPSNSGIRGVSISGELYNRKSLNFGITYAPRLQAEKLPFFTYKTVRRRGLASISTAQQKVYRRICCF